MKFRKKPVEVEAIRLIKDSRGIVRVNECPTWWSEAVESKHAKTYKDEISGEICFVIHTLEGDHVARVGDYIIRGIKGELYPCKPDIFEQTYEVVRP